MYKLIEARMFLGHSTNEVGREEDVGASDTSGQTALFVCSQISANMKNLQQELRGLTSAVRHLQSERSNQEEASRKNGKKSVAKGLPVRFRVSISDHIILIFMLCSVEFLCSNKSRSFCE